MKNEMYRQEIVKELIRRYPNALNVRGIIVSSIGLNNVGTVHFSIMNTKHPKFGSNNRKYQVKTGGKIKLL